MCTPRRPYWILLAFSLPPWLQPSSAVATAVALGAMPMMVECIGAMPRNQFPDAIVFMSTFNVELPCGSATCFTSQDRTFEWCSSRPFLQNLSTASAVKKTLRVTFLSAIFESQQPALPLARLAHAGAVRDGHGIIVPDLGYLDDHLGSLWADSQTINLKSSHQLDIRLVWLHTSWLSRFSISKLFVLFRIRMEPKRLLESPTASDCLL